MKISVITLFTLLLAAAAAPTVHAQTFTDTTAVTDDSDVNKDGTTALAFSFYNSVFNNSTTVNSVLFSGNETQNGVTLTLTNFVSSANNGDTQVGSMSTNYFDILSRNNYIQSSTVHPTLELSGLTAGHTYELELFDGSVFVNGLTSLQDSGSSGELLYGPANTPSGAFFTTETFVAGSSLSETVTYAPIVDNYLIVNAVNLRDLGVTPEPSTYALLLSGLAFLGFRMRRGFSSQT